MPPQVLSSHSSGRISLLLSFSVSAPPLSPLPPRDQQQQIRSEITMATFNLISRSYELLSMNQTLNPIDTTTARKFDGIPIDLFRNLIRAHSWRFPPLKGLRKPNSSFETFSDSSRFTGETQEGFEIDLNILLLILWRTYQSCHNSDLCSAQYSKPHLSPLPFNDWTEKWREKFDVPPALSLVDVSMSQNPELMQLVQNRIGGCSCTFGGPFSSHLQLPQQQQHPPETGDRIPREMFIQFFLVTILKADSEFFDLPSIAISTENQQQMTAASDTAPRSSHDNNDFEDEESKFSKISFSFLSSSEISRSNPPLLPHQHYHQPQTQQQLDTPTHRRGGTEGSGTDPLLKRKSRRFFTAVTDVFVSPVVNPVYFNEGWRQCWLASRFLFRERPPEHLAAVPHSKIFFHSQWWRSEFERIIGSQEFDLLTDAMFATVMILFLGFFPSVGLMVTWTIYAVLETTLRLSFKGIRRFIFLPLPPPLLLFSISWSYVRVQRSMRDSSDAFMSLLMVRLNSPFASPHLLPPFHPLPPGAHPSRLLRLWALSP
jgi:hypothetical protein